MFRRFYYKNIHFEQAKIYLPSYLGLNLNLTLSIVRFLLVLFIKLLFIMYNFLRREHFCILINKKCIITSLFCLS